MTVDSSSHRNTCEKLSLTGSSVVERSCVVNDTHSLAIHNSVQTAEDTHHESQSSVVYPVYDEIGQAHLTSQHHSSPTAEAINSRQQPSPVGKFLSQIPFPYLRTDQDRPNPSQDLAYESSKMNNHTSMMNQDVSRVLLQSNVSYGKLRDGRPQALTGQGPIPVYNNIDLKGVCPPVRVSNDTVILQANDSYGIYR